MAPRALKGVCVTGPLSHRGPRAAESRHTGRRAQQIRHTCRVRGSGGGPDGTGHLVGKAVIVTGATSGIGFAAARALAAAGASVCLAVRSVERGVQAQAAIRSQYPDADVEVQCCDLANLASIRQFANEWLSAHPEGPDILINNAGVIARRPMLTADGFERTIGTNHLGHFALTGLLLPAIVNGRRQQPSPGHADAAQTAQTAQTAHAPARIVTVTSLAHRWGRIRAGEWAPTSGRTPARAFRPWHAYAQSKLANAVLTVELRRRLAMHALPIASIGVHPGIAVTNVLIPGLTTPGVRTPGSRLGAALARLVVPSADQAAAMLEYAAGSPQAARADQREPTMVRPSGMLHLRGRPETAIASEAARGRQLGRDLWRVSEAATGVHYLDEPPR